MDDRAALAAHRYRLLLRQFRVEWNAMSQADRGFYPWAGKRLGVSGNYIGMIWREERPEAAPIAEAMQTARIKPSFFYEGSMVDEPSYKDHLEAPRPALRVVRDANEMKAVTEYFERYWDRAELTSDTTDYASLREHVNATLNARSGDLEYAVVRNVIDSMIERHGYK
jgi:hypothetical protein